MSRATKCNLQLQGEASNTKPAQAQEFEPLEETTKVKHAALLDDKPKATDVPCTILAIVNEVPDSILEKDRIVTVYAEWPSGPCIMGGEHVYFHPSPSGFSSVCVRVPQAARHLHLTSNIPNAKVEFGRKQDIDPGMAVKMRVWMTYFWEWLRRNRQAEALTVRVLFATHGSDQVAEAVLWIFKAASMQVRLPKTTFVFEAETQHNAQVLRAWLQESQFGANVVVCSTDCQDLAANNGNACDSSRASQQACDGSTPVLVFADTPNAKHVGFLSEGTKAALQTCSEALIYLSSDSDHHRKHQEDQKKQEQQEHQEHQEHQEQQEQHNNTIFQSLTDLLLPDTSFVVAALDADQVNVLVHSFTEPPDTTLKDCVAKILQLDGLTILSTNVA